MYSNTFLSFFVNVTQFFNMFNFFFFSVEFKQSFIVIYQQILISLIMNSESQNYKYHFNLITSEKGMLVGKPALKVNIDLFQNYFLNWSRCPFSFQPPLRPHLHVFLCFYPINRRPIQVKIKTVKRRCNRKENPERINA